MLSNTPSRMISACIIAPLKCATKVVKTAIEEVGRERTVFTSRLGLLARYDQLDLFNWVRAWAHVLGVVVRHESPTTAGHYPGTCDDPFSLAICPNGWGDTKRLSL
jgi:hypothetical protein